MQIQLYELLGVYLPVTVGVIAQFVLLALPIDLKNWRDDSINVLTYIGVQLSVACGIFVIIPDLYDLFRLGVRESFLLLCVVGVAALFRCIKTIPLEGTSASVSFLPAPPVVNFIEFYEKLRLISLSSLSEHDPEDLRRIIAIKERIRKRDIDGSTRGGLPKGK